MPDSSRSPVKPRLFENIFPQLEGLPHLNLVNRPTPVARLDRFSALRQGLHVLCEKPIAVYTLAAREMIRAAQQSGKTFALMFNQRTNPLYRRMKELLSSGEMGAIKRVNWIITDWYRTQVYYDSGAWRGDLERPEGWRRAAQPVSASTGSAAMAVRYAPSVSVRSAMRAGGTRLR